jgi:hypothetical protein
VIRSPLAARASAQGFAASPVHTLALMIASVATEAAVAGVSLPFEQDTRSRAQISGSVRISG